MSMKGWQYTYSVVHLSWLLSHNDMLSSDPWRMESVLFFHSLIFISSVKLFTNKDACLVASLLFRFLVFCFVLFKIKEACASKKHWCYVFVLFCFSCDSPNYIVLSSLGTVISYVYFCFFTSRHRPHRLLGLWVHHLLPHHPLQHQQPPLPLWTSLHHFFVQHCLLPLLFTGSLLHSSSRLGSSSPGQL